MEFSPQTGNSLNGNASHINGHLKMWNVAYWNCLWFNVWFFFSESENGNSQKRIYQEEWTILCTPCLVTSGFRFPISCHQTVIHPGIPVLWRTRDPSIMIPQHPTLLSRNLAPDQIRMSWTLWRTAYMPTVGIQTLHQWMKLGDL